MSALAATGNHSRSARLQPLVYAGVAVLAAQLPPLFPPRFAELVTPTWYAIAVVSGALGLVVMTRPSTGRLTVLGLGWLQAALTLWNAFVVGDGLAMFCTWLSVPVLASLAARIGARARKALLVSHVITSAAWLGLSVMFVAMSVTAMTTTEIDTARVTYELMVVYDMSLLPVANFAASLTGIGLGLTTAWGLMRYYWVAIKFFIPPVILLMAFGFLHDALESAAHQAARLSEVGGTVGRIDSAANVVFWGFGLAMVLLLAAMLLSQYKPGGKTRRGRRSSEPRSGKAMPVTLTDSRPIAQDVLALTLRRTNGAAFPQWQPGAHIDLVLPSGKVRQYSLYGDPGDRKTVRIAVLCEEGGRGGSMEIHRVPAGTNLAIRGPRNTFPLVDAPAHLFVAGGIGVVPFLPMIARLAAAGAQWRLIYRGKSLGRMAFAAALAQYGNRVMVAPADRCARPDLSAMLRDTPAGVAVYCCGPESMLTAVTAAMPAHGTLYRERFAPTERRDADNAPFEAELRRSGVTVDVPAEQTLLSAIQRIEPSVDMSCSDGVCGSCRTRVLAGTPEHRDDVLQPHERERTDVIYPCVSRARGKRIVLDV